MWKKVPKVSRHSGKKEPEFEKCGKRYQKRAGVAAKRNLNFRNVEKGTKNELA